MERDKFKCSNCQRDDIELNVHHKRYCVGRNPWDYSMNDLVTLCKNCHAYEHSILPTDDSYLKHDFKNHKHKEREFPNKSNKIPVFSEIVAEINRIAMENKKSKNE